MSNPYDSPSNSPEIPNNSFRSVNNTYQPNTQTPLQNNSLATPPPPLPRNVIGNIAMVLALVGTIFSCVPSLMLLGWLMLPTALILGIIGVVQIRKSHTTSIVAIILSIVGAIIAVIVVLATFIGVAMQQGNLSEDSNWSDTNSWDTSSGSSSTTNTEPGSTRDNPLPLGSTVSSKTWNVTVNSVNLNAAEALAEPDLFNEPPAEGETYIMVNITATYTGNDPQGDTPWAHIKFVSAEGRSFDRFSKFLVPPDYFDSSQQLYTGASTTGNIALAVKDTDPSTGVLAVEADILDDAVFVAVK